MQFRLTRMRHLGRPLDQAARRSAPAPTCQILIQHENCVLGRSSVVARVTGDWPLEQPPIPELLEVQLHSMVPNGMILTGIEIIDGVAYAQSWLCRPLG